MLIDFIDDFNNIEIIYHEKSTLQMSVKPDITCNSYYMNSSVMLQGNKLVIARDVDTELEEAF